MSTLTRFAVLQKDLAGPTVEQCKRAFRNFSNLTDADAVRLALGARGILMRHLDRDLARALQRALQAAGAAVIMVAEDELPVLPDGLSLHRAELWPQSFTAFDPFGRPTAVPWPDVALVAAGATQQMEDGKTHTDHALRRLQTGSAARPAAARPGGRGLPAEPQWVIELLLADGVGRYQIDAAQFSFRAVIDRPGLRLEEQLIWLVREIGHHATRAVLNFGARRLCEGEQSVPVYGSRRALIDEIIWLLWRHSREKQGPAP
jgi:hypothetical protein